MTHHPDIVDELADVAPDSPIDALRRRRPETRAQIQASYDALFAPLSDADVSLAERWVVAAFVARLGADPATARHYSTHAHGADPARAAIALALADAASTEGPYGAYNERGLQDENTDGLRFGVSAERGALGERLSAALEHAHRLVYRPRESSADALDALLAAGWSIDGIVTLSQLIAFLSFQQRVVSGLRVLTPEVSA